MTWTTKFFGIAEAAAFDMRGNITASGLCPPLLQVESFPVQINPWVILIVESHDTEGEPPRSGSLQLEVTGPDGNALVAMQQEVALQAKRVKGLPARAQIAAQLPMQAPKSGIYRVRVSFDFKSHGASSHELELPIWDLATFRSNQES